MAGKSQKGAHEIIFDSVTSESTSITIRKDLWKHIVLSGGTTMLRGFSGRLKTELEELVTKKIFAGDRSKLKTYKIGIEDSERRKVLVFHGASLFGKLIENRNEMWITKKEWEEKGQFNFLDYHYYAPLYDDVSRCADDP